MLCAKPDVLGPGVNIVSALPGGTVGPASGTSMAAAFVAGLAALLFEAKPSASAEEVESAIIGSATPVSDDQRHRCAGGIVQPLAAVDALLNRGMRFVKSPIKSDNGTSVQFVDTLLERRLRHSSKDAHVEAILGSTDFPALISAIEDVSGRLNEKPRRVRHYPRGRLSVMLATRHFLEQLLMREEISCAHAPVTEEWTLNGY